MKNTLKQLKEVIVRDQKAYFRKVIKISKKIRTLKDKKNKNPIEILHLFLLTIKRNKLSPKRNIWLMGKLGEDIKIWHQNVVINPYAEIGDCVVFHGNNCIGNNGKNIKACPKIGNNIEIGYGAIIIGDVVIADNVIIGAGSVVTKSVLEKGAIVAGVPAKIIKHSRQIDEDEK